LDLNAHISLPRLEAAHVRVHASSNSPFIKLCSSHGSSGV